MDYSIYDHPRVLAYLFHPRPEEETIPGDSFIELMIPTDDNCFLGSRFYHSGLESPTILFFHGNGEIVADYSDLGPIYNKLGINFAPVDYRGYGKSSGSPTVTAMMMDCEIIYQFYTDWLSQKNYTGPLIIMGRSLGSASALELASRHNISISALIVESGFAYAIPLLRLLGIDTDSLNIKEEKGFRNKDKITQFTNPTLIIHAEYDHIIPFTDGEALYQASKAERKEMIKIPGANHNTIFAYGLEEYMKGIKVLINILINPSKNSTNQ